MATRIEGMTPRQFKALQKRLGWTNGTAAEKLGVTINGIEKMRQGPGRVTLTLTRLIECWAEREGIEVKRPH